MRVVTNEDIKKYDLEDYPVKDTDAGDMRALKKAKDAIKNDPFFQDKKNRKLTAVLEWLLKNKRRCEQQAYIGADPNDPLIMEKIIIEKIKRGNYI